MDINLISIVLLSFSAGIIGGMLVLFAFLYAYFNFDLDFDKIFSKRTQILEKGRSKNTFFSNILPTSKYYSDNKKNNTESILYKEPIATQYLNYQNIPQAMPYKQYKQFRSKQKLYQHPKGLNDHQIQLIKKRISSHDIDKFKEGLDMIKDPSLYSSKDKCNPLIINHFIHFELMDYKSLEQRLEVIKNGIVFPLFTEEFDPVIFFALKENVLSIELVEALVNCGADLYAKDLEGEDIIDKLLNVNVAYYASLPFNHSDCWINGLLYLLNKNFSIDKRRKSLILDKINNHYISQEKKDEVLQYFASIEKEELEKELDIVNKEIYADIDGQRSRKSRKM